MTGPDDIAAGEPGAVAARRALIRVLQAAHAGEGAATLAYEGHARSLRDDVERAEILEIRQQEIDHRACVARMLASLGAAPAPRRERIFALIGRTIALLCRIGGWYVPMYGAGRLEAGNIREYEIAARHAVDAGRADLLDELLAMAEVEWDHERHFREKVLTHPLRHVLRIWPAPPPRASIRAPFRASVPAHA